MQYEESVNGIFDLGLFPPRELWRPTLESCLARIAAAGDRDASIEALVSDYERPRRHYHVLGHALETVRAGEALRALAGLELDPEQRSAFVAAALCHDAVYEKGARDNEERSAAYARDFCRALRLGPRIGEEAAALVVATKHLDIAPASGLEALMRDADLAVLASPRDRYAAYAALIRREAGELDEEDYRRARRGFISSFLGRERLFRLEGPSGELERRARLNLAEELGRLSGQAR